MALLLDGHTPGNNNPSSTTNGVSLTATSGALLFCYFWSNNGPTNISSVTDSGPGLTWAQFALTGGSFGAFVYWTKCTSAFSATVSVNFVAIDASTVGAFSVTGQDTTTGTSWQDGTPAVLGGAGSVVGDINYTTVHSNTMAVNCSRFGSTVSPTAASPWTLIDGANSLGAEYQLIPGGPTLTTSAYTLGATNENATISFAIVAAAAAGTPGTGPTIAGGPGIIQSVRMIGTKGQDNVMRPPPQPQPQLHVAAWASQVEPRLRTGGYSAPDGGFYNPKALLVPADPPQSLSSDVIHPRRIIY